MPRRANDRQFGFRSAGLVRILKAVDEDELLTALLELNLFFIDPTSLFDELLTLITDTITPYSELISFLEESLAVLALGVFELLEDPAPGEEEAARELQRLIGGVNIEIRRLRADETTFTSRQASLEEQTKEQIAITFL